MKFELVVPFILMLATLSACGPRQSLSLNSSDLSTSQVGTETYLNMDANVSVGSLKFPTVEVPVYNPTNSQLLGKLLLENLVDGTNHIFVSVDFTAAMRLDPLLGRTLPNQRELPTILGMDSTAAIIGIPVLNYGRIYLGTDAKKNLYMGAAIAVAEFDQILTQLPFPLNVFYGFPFTSQLTGYAGLFTGTQTGQNGIGIFMKKSEIPVPLTNRFITGGEELYKIDQATLIDLNQLFQSKEPITIH